MQDDSFCHRVGLSNRQQLRITMRVHAKAVFAPLIPAIQCALKTQLLGHLPIDLKGSSKREIDCIELTAVYRVDKNTRRKNKSQMETTLAVLVDGRSLLIYGRTSIYRFLRLAK